MSVVGLPQLTGLLLDRLQESLRVPRVLGGRYHVLKALGRGGMGVVYLAEDSRLQRKVAVKVIDPALASTELEARLEREALLLARLSHPGIVPIYDLGRQDELTLFYVMKHVDGETLERWLPLHTSRAERLRLFQKLCDPVSFAHAQGIAHRDLKPANVMIGAFGEVLVMDWGLARTLDGQVEADDVGTPGYRDSSSGSAPEPVAAERTRGDGEAISSPPDLAHRTHDVVRSDRGDGPTAAEGLIAADVFSLGAILFFLLTGQHPKPSAEPLQPRRLDRTIDPRLNAICASATHPSRAERYGSARELEADVLRHLDGESVLAYRERWYETAGRWIRRHQLWLSLILMYLLMRVIVALLR
jgi:serine/threonine protein kinase